MKFQREYVIFSDIVQRPKNLWIVEHWCYADIHQQGADMQGTTYQTTRWYSMLR